IISVSNDFACTQMHFNALELRKPNCGGDISHSIVVADHGKPVTSLGSHTLASVESKPGCELIVISRDHASFAGGDDLVSEKAKCGAGTVAPDPPTLIFCPYSFGGIFKDKQTVTLGEFEKGI